MPFGSALPQIDRLSRNARRMRAGLIVANLLIGALLAGLAMLVLDRSRHAYEARARETTDSLATVAQANVRSELDRVDTLMRSALEQVQVRISEHAPTDAAINRILEVNRSLVPAIEGMRMTDEAGNVRWGNDLPPGDPVNVADRDYFERARKSPAAGTQLSGPLRSRVSGNWVVAIVRPVMSNGRFDGVIYASVSLAYFQQIFGRYELERLDSMGLRTTDLQLIARHVPGSTGAAQPGSTDVSPTLRQAMAKSPGHGTVVSRASLDGIERTTTYKKVDTWPLIVLAGVANERFFAPWRELVWQVALLAAFAWLLIACASYLLFRGLKRDLDTHRALGAQTHRLQSLLRVAGDGIHIVDRSGHLVGMSDSFADMLGTTREQLMGRHISSWDVNQDEARIAAWLARIKPGDRQRVEVQHRRADGGVIDVEMQLSVAEVQGELFVFSSARDVTEKKRLLASIEESSARIRDLYDNAPCGYHSLDADGVFVHVNATLLGWLGLPAEEVVGKAHIRDFIDEPSRTRFGATFARLKAEGRLDGVEFGLVPAAGPRRMLRASVSIVRAEDGTFLMSRTVTQDITAQHDAQMQAARLMREQTAMLDNDVVAMVKLRGRYAVWKNRALDRLFGYEPGELDGKPARMLYPDDASFEAVGAAAYPMLAQGLHYRTQLQLVHKTGRLMWVDLSGVAVDDDTSFWMMVDISAMKEMQARIEHVAFHDALTQLPNRLLLADRMSQAIAVASRSEGRIVVCYLDLDGFKQVNDRHGHDTGDALLVEVAKRLQFALRGNDTAARIGGDEFVVVLTMLGADDEWEPIVQRVMASLQEPIELPNGVTVQVGTSVGVSIAPDDGLDIARLLAGADRAMLRAKRAGRGRIERVTEADRM